MGSIGGSIGVGLLGGSLNKIPNIAHVTMDAEDGSADSDLRGAIPTAMEFNWVVDSEGLNLVPP